MLQLLAVHAGYREAMLLETSDFSNNVDRDYLTIAFDQARNLGLVITKDVLSLPHFPRYFVTRESLTPPPDDEGVGRLLGFTCAGFDFSNLSLDRLEAAVVVSRGTAFQTKPYVEVCNAKQPRDILLQKLSALVDGFRTILPANEYTVELVTTVLPSTATMYNSLRKGSTQFADDIINAFTNAGLLESDCPVLATLRTENFNRPFFQWLFNICVLEQDSFIAQFDNMDADKMRELELRHARFVNGLAALVEQDSEVAHSYFN